jgi:hypothetical protein
MIFISSQASPNINEAHEQTASRVWEELTREKEEFKKEGRFHLKTWIIHKVGIVMLRLLNSFDN